MMLTSADNGVAAWFLSRAERDNPATGIPDWIGGNRVEPLIHGAAYFDRLVEVVDAMGHGDYLYFMDWRGDPDERLRADGPTVAGLLTAAARRGIVVKGLVWRSHPDELQFSEEENRSLAEEVEAAGGEVLLDQRVRRGGSHHQKLVVIRHPGRPERDVAFVGGVDLCHGRRDDESHRGDPQAVPMSPAYGEHPPWHDVQLEVHGPAVGALDLCFRERWEDRHSPDSSSPFAFVSDALHGADLHADPLPEQPPDPPPGGPHALQVLRTYPAKRPPYDFAPLGEHSIARAYTKAVRRARRLIYIEDQYLWSKEVARLFADALHANPELHLVAVVPRHPDVDGTLASPPNLVGRAQAIQVCREAAGDRVHVFDVENPDGAPVYVHAKVCVVDDVWASVGSDNFNRRSWTHDTEIGCAVLDATRDRREPTDPAGLGDEARVFARDLRLRLWREHLDRGVGEVADLVDPAAAVAAIRASAERLDSWHRAGRVGPRPTGRLRPHEPERLSWWTRMWAVPAYRLLYDPDGRPLRARRRRTW